jgi:hypothetical protein
MNKKSSQKKLDPSHSPAKLPPKTQNLTHKPEGPWGKNHCTSREARWKDFYPVRNGEAVCLRLVLRTALFTLEADG